MNKQYILGLDCSTVATGWCIIDKTTNQLFKSGCLKIDSKDNPNTINRIINMMFFISNLIKKYKPKEIVAEDVPPSVKNSFTVKQLSTLKGCTLTLANLNSIPVTYILPNVWQPALGIKKANGSTKQQSVRWVNKKYNKRFTYKSEGSKFNDDDETDSICIASYYLGNYDKPKRLERKKK